MKKGQINYNHPCRLAGRAHSHIHEMQHVITRLRLWPTTMDQTRLAGHKLCCLEKRTGTCWTTRPPTAGTHELVRPAPANANCMPLISHQEHERETYSFWDIFWPDVRGQK